MSKSSCCAICADTHASTCPACKIKEGICTGCHRTLEQIGAWGSMTDKERQEAMAKMGYTHPASSDVPIGMSERLDVLAQGLKNLQRNSGSDVYQWGFVGAMLKDVQSMISDCVPQLEDRPTLGQRKAAQIGKE